MDWTDFERIFHRTSLKPMMQTEITECGLVCIAMVANFYGHDIDLSALRLRFPVSSRGLNLGHLINIAADLKLDSRPVRVELQDIGSLDLPCILHWNLNHFVVCESVTPEYVKILDPQIGRRRLTMKEVSKSFTGVALELFPRKDFVPVVYSQKIRLSQFWSNLVGVGQSVNLLLAVCMVLLVLTLLSPYLSMFVIDEVLTTRDMALLNLISISFGFVAVFYTIANFLRNYLVLYIGSQFAVQMSRNLIRHLLHLPLSFFEKRHIGDIMSRLGSLDFVKRILTEEVVAVLIDGAIMSLAFFLMLAYSPKLALLVLSSIGIYAVVRTITYQAFRQASEEALLAEGMESSSLLETIRGIQSIKLYGGERSRITVWMQLYMKVMNANVRAGRAKIWGAAANSLIFGLENVLVIYLGAKSVLDQELTIGVFVAFLSYKTQFTEKMASLIEKMFDFRLLSLHLDRMGDIILQKQETMQTSPSGLSFEGSISARSLSYRYSPQEPYLFEHLSFDIQSGESVAIVGPSGSGKTTLVKILLGLLEPDVGEVLVDSIDIRKVKADYRNQIATVMQDDRLITGSIADNIAFFDPEPSVERIKRCGIIACVDDEIMAMTMNYYSLVSDMGASLSGGQKQRVLLARALYRQPRILFLDEATSNLDVELERAINHAIKELKITRIIIAHRPETIASAERVLKLEDKKLVEVKS